MGSLLSSSSSSSLSSISLISILKTHSSGGFVFEMIGLIAFFFSTAASASASSFRKRSFTISITEEISPPVFSINSLNRSSFSLTPSMFFICVISGGSSSPSILKSPSLSLLIIVDNRLLKTTVLRFARYIFNNSLFSFTCSSTFSIFCPCVCVIKSNACSVSSNFPATSPNSLTAFDNSSPVCLNSFISSCMASKLALIASKSVSFFR
mmetsp:Transcript_18638/g.24207  ORF Transcript_18638/g.24207 Transcript_18638/m.24207 type:complete len:209 (-) Transcript_18638:479-1105(-)